MQHHPDLMWSWTRVKVTVTHDAGYQLTQLDWDYAALIEPIEYHRVFNGGRMGFILVPNPISGPFHRRLRADLGHCC